jgi:uncharacterized delta-60 repeat protein
VPALAAFDAAGNLQTSFGEGGVLRLTALAAPPGGFASPGVEALARRPDGSLVAVGSAPPNRSVAFLAALSPQGSLLPTFGEGGIVEVREPTPATESVAGLAPIEGGGVLAAADTDVGTGTHPALVRYAADGTLDTTFGDGTGFVSLPGGGEATRIAVDGEETLVGVEGKRRDRLFMLRTGDGSPVSSFGAGGVLNLAHGIGVQAVATAPDGEPIVLTKGGLDAPPVVERLGADGRPDRSFGRGGKVTLRLPGGGEPSGGALVVTPAGRILVGAISGKRVALARLLPDGRLDRRFGARGWSVTGLGEGVGSMMLAPAGARLYVAATYGHGDRQRLGLLRLGAAGGRDRGFGHRGLRTVGGVSYTRVTAVEPTPAGVVVAVEKGVRPLFTFAKGGGVRQRPAEPDGRRAGDVHATLSAGRLFVGWSPYLGQYGQDPSYHVAVRAAGR